MKKVLLILAAASMCLVACNKEDKTPSGDNKPGTEQPGEGEGDEFVPAITVDGKFDDWGTATILGTATCPEGNMKDGIKTMKVAADGMYIYLYFEMTPAKFDKAGYAPMSIYIDNDNDATTGTTCDWMFNGAFLYVLQGGMAGEGAFSTFDPGVTEWTGEDGIGFWDDETAHTDILAEGSGVGAGAGVEESGVVKYECSLMRTLLPKLGETIAIGAYLSDGSWSEVGCVPAGADVDGQSVAADLLVINLPAALE